MKTLLTTAAVIALGASAASAASVTFDLTGQGGATFDTSPSTVSLTDAATGLTANFDAKAFRRVAGTGPSLTGTTVSPDAIILDSTFSAASGGVGIFSTAIDSNPAIDGTGAKEFVQISFDQDVTITAVSLEILGGIDGVRLITDTNGDGMIGVGDTFSERAGVAGFPATLSLAAGEVFAFGGFWKADAFTLSDLTVEVADPPAVPLPAGGALLLTGIAGIALAKRRRKQA